MQNENLDIETRLGNIERSVNQILMVMTDVLEQLDMQPEQQPQQRNRKDTQTKRKKNQQQIESEAALEEAKLTFLDMVEDGKKRTIPQMREESGLSRNKIEKLLAIFKQTGIIMMEPKTSASTHKYYYVHKE